MMRMRSGSTQRRGGFVLIEIVVVLAIIVLLTGLYFGLIGRGRGGKNDKSLPGQVMDKAVDTTCQSNIRQLRMSIQMDVTSNEKPPASLKAAAKDLGTEFMKCPTSGEAYDYDPSTGTVHCKTPGHEEY